MAKRRVFLFHFLQTHEDFRLAEWRSVCRLVGLEKYVDVLQEATAPLVLLEIDDEEEIRRLLGRLVLLKSVFEVLGQNDGDHDALVQWLAEDPPALKELRESPASWCLRVRAVGKKRTADYVNAVLEVDLRNPDVEFSIVEQVDAKTGEVQRSFFTRLVGHGQTELKSRYSLKERRYIGNSTMDPELALLQANLSGVRPGALVCDPFAGTGGLLIAAAHFGGLVLGDGDQLPGGAKGRSARMGEGDLRAGHHSVAANFVQYKLEDRFLGLVLADASKREMWRVGADGLFDVMVADPPYGVREKGSKLGKKERNPNWLESTNEHEVFFPEKTKYSISSTYLDLMDSAAQLLTAGGFLSFWFPIVRQSYSPKVLPKHPAMTLVHNCEQVLTSKCSRFVPAIEGVNSRGFQTCLLVFRKERPPTSEEKAEIEENCFESSSFRDAVFKPQKADS
ncbi:TRNA (guanine(10)-N2)-methyltransferase-like protein [Aphelenchoides fujianensis]|nr:TRNA (guanine(10)-N2)-methyltransferase-like protein [Aphelenchoides fujianensis]